jgi:hypothetical protein
VAKPQNFGVACRQIETTYSSGEKSLRILVPRLISSLYEIRNNRNVGHIGADINPNHIDAMLMLYASKWIIAEFVRLLHKSTIEDASEIVERLAERSIPTVWTHEQLRRVLKPDLPFNDKVLLLLYSGVSPANGKDIFEWSEHSNWTSFKKTVLKPLHVAKLIEFSENTCQVFLLPPGIARVEDALL